MKLTKAIEIKELANKSPGSVSPVDYVIADNLSIEALKRIRENRIHPPWHPDTRLPGETEE